MCHRTPPQPTGLVPNTDLAAVPDHFLSNKLPKSTIVTAILFLSKNPSHGPYPAKLSVLGHESLLLLTLLIINPLPVPPPDRRPFIAERGAMMSTLLFLPKRLKTNFTQRGTIGHPWLKNRKSLRKASGVQRLTTGIRDLPKFLTMIPLNRTAKKKLDARRKGWYSCNLTPS